MFIEGKKVKKVEGVPPKAEQVIQDDEAIIITRTTKQKSASKRKEKNKNEGLDDEKKISPALIPTSSVAAE